MRNDSGPTNTEEEIPTTQVTKAKAGHVYETLGEFIMISLIILFIGFWTTLASSTPTVHPPPPI